MNLGVIVLDTLRVDVSFEEMTALYNLSDRCFQNFYSTGRWTSPAHASLFTGYYPTEVGTHADQKHLTTPKPTIAELLRDNGYETIAASNNINIDHFFDFDRGFTRFERGPGIKNRPEEDEAGLGWHELEKKIADSGIRRPIEAIYYIYKSNTPTIPTLKTGFEMFTGTSEDEPGIEWSEEVFDNLAEDPPEDFFFFANYMPCHYPYDPPKGYCDLDPVDQNPIGMTLRDKPVTEGEHERYWQNYIGAARYLDDALPELIDRIDWDCLFVISDHGELFADHDLYGHQYGVYEGLTKVPAMAFGSEVPEGTTTAPTSILDIPKTLLKLAGIEPESDMRGMNLFEDIPENRVVYAESEGCEWYDPNATGIEAKIPASWAKPHYMITRDDVMYVSDKDGERAFELDTGTKRPDLVEELRDKTQSIRDDRRDYTGETVNEELTEEIESQLEHLGYK
jgi:arylsulfatase